MVRIGLIGDRNETVVAHRAIDAALGMIADVEAQWLHTSSIPDLHGFHGLWCVPASPYADGEAALESIRFARENEVPFLGSCGGFQHAVIEFARNVMGLGEADHAETNPDSTMPVITALSCGLVEVSGEVVLEPGSLIRNAYADAARIEEGYHCNYGFNAAYQPLLLGDGEMWATAHDAQGDVRGVELREHPFFVATLFQSERRALRGELPPLVREFVAKARTRAGS